MMDLVTTPARARRAETVVIDLTDLASADQLVVMLDADALEPVDRRTCRVLEALAYCRVQVVLVTSDPPHELMRLHVEVPAAWWFHSNVLVAPAQVIALLHDRVPGAPVLAIGLGAQLAGALGEDDRAVSLPYGQSALRVTLWSIVRARCQPK